jgi:hypothetical protein
MHGLAEIRRANAPAPLFQKRHYPALAEMIKATRALPHDSADELWADLIEALVERFAADNPEFRPDAFRAACGVNGHRFTEDNR